jgi:EAL domain-containing protein (putative c-di-GMP-specific phosphodiesterase class I)
MALAPTSARGEEAASTSIEWSRRIREALDRDSFALHAQRIVDVGTGQTLRHELFLRMVDEQRLIPAGEFVMVAEELGLIGEIDRWGVGKAIEIAACGHAIHLNLSMRSIDAALLDLIRERLEETGADPANLVFELGEAQLSEADEDGVDFVRVAAELGCPIAVDNFTGGDASSLLRHYPLRYVKVGPALVGGITASPEARQTVSRIVLAGHRAGQRIIGQGVETLASLTALEELDVDEAQGHVFGPAEPVELALGSSV